MTRISANEQKTLQNHVLQAIVNGHGRDKMYEHPPSMAIQLNMAAEELDHMTHSEFLDRLSDAIEEMFPHAD